ncbi:hypothetical protein SDC9_115305 [bioreactor metagenome]|uniref:Uncharacterized protein n=1 Tax=bioreactor metagenome TaxID=1076179 RepID=A0A645BZ37_9ZZZZ
MVDLAGGNADEFRNRFLAEQRAALAAVLPLDAFAFVGRFGLRDPVSGRMSGGGVVVRIAVAVVLVRVGRVAHFRVARRGDDRFVHGVFVHIRPQGTRKVGDLVTLKARCRVGGNDHRVVLVFAKIRFAVGSAVVCFLVKRNARVDGIVLDVP